MKVILWKNPEDFKALAKIKNRKERLRCFACLVDLRARGQEIYDAMARQIMLLDRRGGKLTRYDLIGPPLNLGLDYQLSEDLGNFYANVILHMHPHLSIHAPCVPMKQLFKARWRLGYTVRKDAR